MTARVDVMCCSFYNGNYWRIETQLDWRPNRFLQFQPRYTYQFIDLPTGSVGIHLATLAAIVNFTPDMQLFNEIQFDNISQNFALVDALSLGIPAGRRDLRLVRTGRRDSGNDVLCRRSRKPWSGSEIRSGSSSLFPRFLRARSSRRADHILKVPFLRSFATCLGRFLLDGTPSGGVDENDPENCAALRRLGDRLRERELLQRRFSSSSRAKPRPI